jgi:hypothetical protein
VQKKIFAVCRAWHSAKNVFAERQTTTLGKEIEKKENFLCRALNKE